MDVQPYLFFDGRCEEAVEFYQQAVGAQVLMLMRYADAPPASAPPEAVAPGSQNKVMHVSFKVGSSTLMASDDCSPGVHDIKGFSLSINAADAAEATRLFNALADGGTVRMPLEKTFWSPLYGMVTDRFGVNWMVSVAH